MLFLGLLCGGNEGIILRQLTFAANLATINKVSVREWRNGRRAGFRHQFQRSEGSTPFSRIKMAPSPCLGSFFILRRRGVEQHGRPQAASNQPGGLLLRFGLWHPASASALERALHPAGHGPNSFSLLPPLLQVPPCRNVYGGRCRCAAPSPCLGSFFILRRREAEQHGRPQAASDQPGNLEESLPTRLDEHPQNLYTIRSRRNTK